MSAGPGKPEEMGWRVPVSIVAFFGFAISLVLWLSFYAEGFSLLQNAAVAFVVFLAFVAVMGATWASWGMKNANAGS